MSKILLRAIGFFALLGSLCLPVGAVTGEQLYSRTAVLIDADSGQVLFDKDMHERMYPASTTKIMTGLLVAELCDPADVLTVSQSAVDIEEWNSTNIALVPGEQLTVADAMYAMMLHSANDVSNALAEHVAGSQERFVELMNQRALEMGLVNTHFANAHGLHDPDHYTTSHDMAIITANAAQNPDFMRYFSQDYHVMASTNLQPEARSFMNYQYMLLEDSYFYYPAAYGGKVGYTTEAQHTMSTIARSGDRTLICTVMYSGERTQKFTDTKRLLDYGFEDFYRYTMPRDLFETGVIPASGGEVSFSSDNDFTALIHKDVDPATVQVHFDLPQTFSADDRLPSYVRVTARTSDGESVLLGHQALVAELVLADGVVPMLAQRPSLPPIIWGSSTEEFTVTPQFLAVLVLSGILLILVGFVIARYQRVKRRRREQLERLGRRVSCPVRRSA